MISVRDMAIGWIFDKLETPEDIEAVASAGLSNEHLCSLEQRFGDEAPALAGEVVRQCSARVVAEEAAMVAAAAAAVAAEPDHQPACVPHDADGLMDACVSAVSGYIRTHGCPVAAQVGSRDLDDREVVILLRPSEASDDTLREFSLRACRGWDSAGQFSPGLPLLLWGEEALAWAEEVDADEDDNSGAIRLD